MLCNWNATIVFHSNLARLLIDCHIDSIELGIAAMLISGIRNNLVKNLEKARILLDRLHLEATLFIESIALIGSSFSGANIHSGTFQTMTYII